MKYWRRFAQQFIALWRREWRYLWHHPWDLVMVSVVPFAVIVLFSTMFSHGKAEHLPIAVVNQERVNASTAYAGSPTLSGEIIKQLQFNQALHVTMLTDDMQRVEQAINRTEIWGYVLIPYGAEQRLIHGQDAQIAIAYNQAFFSIGNSISTAMLTSSGRGIANFLGQDYLRQRLPSVNIPPPKIKVSVLYNPDLNYEFFLEPFMVPAILHLLLCCCVGFACGQEIKYRHLSEWLAGDSALAAILAKVLPYVLIFWAWHIVWWLWLVNYRGWFVAGDSVMLWAAQGLLYLAYGLAAATLLLLSGDMSRAFGLIAVYGGSSLSFAGVTLPLNNAPLFTKFWSNIIPYTPYAKLQTEQWVVGSPISVSIVPFSVLCLYVGVYGVWCIGLLKSRYMPSIHAAQQDAAHG